MPFITRCLPLLVLLPLAATAQPAGSGYAPLQPHSECLDPARVRSWHLIDSTRLLVDAGRRHYLVLLNHACPELGHNPGIVFAGKGPSQRICGYAGEQILPSGSLAGSLRPCDIQRLLRISREEFDAQRAGVNGKLEAHR